MHLWEPLKRHRQFLLFATIGGLATFVDMGALWFALQVLGLNPYAGRIFSFLVAATCTWLFNRNITFKGRRTHGLAVEYLRFIAVAAVGGSVNFAIYSAIVRLGPQALALSPAEIALLPYAGVIVGSLGGLIFNYTGASKLVFKADGGDPPQAPTL